MTAISIDIRRAYEKHPGRGRVLPDGFKKIMGAEDVRFDRLSPNLPGKAYAGDAREVEDPIGPDFADQLYNVFFRAHVQEIRPLIGSLGRFGIRRPVNLEFSSLILLQRAN